MQFDLLFITAGLPVKVQTGRTSPGWADLFLTPQEEPQVVSNSVRGQIEQDLIHKKIFRLNHNSLSKLDLAQQHKDSKYIGGGGGGLESMVFVFQNIPLNKKLNSEAKSRSSIPPPPYFRIPFHLRPLSIQERYPQATSSEDSEESPIASRTRARTTLTQLAGCVTLGTRQISILQLYVYPLHCFMLARIIIEKFF